MHFFGTASNEVMFIKTNFKCFKNYAKKTFVLIYLPTSEKKHHTFFHSTQDTTCE